MAGFCRRRDTHCQSWWTERNAQSLSHNFVTYLRLLLQSDKVTQLNYRSHSSRRLSAKTCSTKTRRTSSGTSTTTTTTLLTTCGSNLSRLGNTSTRFTITSNHLLAFHISRHLELEMFHLSKTKKWIVPVCKDLSRVGLADSPQMDGYHGGYAGLSKMK